MMGSEPFLSGLGRIVLQESSIPALRASVFLFGVFAAFAWLRRRPLLTALAAGSGGLVGLSYWLLQIATPLGLGADPSLTREWAQAGVNASADRNGSSFVFGMDPEVSLVSTLASAGVPLHIVRGTPQWAAVLALALLSVLPFCLLKNRATAAFAASLALGGGLWPGVAPYGSILLRPAALLVASALAGMTLLVSRGPAARRAFHGRRLEISGGLMVAAGLDQALVGGAEAPATAALLLCAATLTLTPPLRAALRKAGPAHRARRLEALVLLCVLSGSGLFWWDPPKSIAGFEEARDVSAALRKPMDWIAANVPTSGVVLASPDYSAPIAAIAGRRVLFPPLAEAGVQTALREPFRRARLSESARQGQPLSRLAEAFSVTHLFLGPGEATPPEGAGADRTDEPRLTLVLVYQDSKDFRVFRLVKK